MLPEPQAWHYSVSTVWHLWAWMPAYYPLAPRPLSLSSGSVGEGPPALPWTKKEAPAPRCSAPLSAPPPAPGACSTPPEAWPPPAPQGSFTGAEGPPPAWLPYGGQLRIQRDREIIALLSLGLSPGEGWREELKGAGEGVEGVERLEEPEKGQVFRPASQKEGRRWPGMGWQVGGGIALSGGPWTHPSSYLMQLI